METVYEIDLHGLTMSETKMVLDEVFEYVKGNINIREIHIVVGVGKGSLMGPVLPAFVVRYVEEKGLVAVLREGVVFVDIKN